MYCKHCGSILSKNIRFCSGCGEQITSVPDSHHYESGGRVGYSDKIHDPAFARFIKINKRWSIILSSVLAVAAVVGFYIAGEMGAEGMENPQALYIGLGIGGMFLVIALFMIIASKRSKTWDGVVVDKTAIQKSENLQRRYGTRQTSVYGHRNYMEYSVVIQTESGKIRRITAVDNDRFYSYFQVGDRVRHHAGLNTYEKYDKSRDSIILCNACTKLNDINNDICSTCKCPLLK